MRKLFTIGVASMFLIPTLAFAQSPFNGTWALVPASLHVAHSKPMVISLKDGVFSGTQDGPTIRLPADGKDHPVNKATGFDTAAVHVINDHSFKEVDKKNEKVVVTALVAASPDGKTLTVDLRKADGSSSVQVSKRVAVSAPGSNATSGTWQFDHLAAASGGEFNIAYNINGNAVTSTNPEGSFTAVLGGKPVPYLDSGMAGITVSVAMPADNVLRETFYKDGREVSTSTFTIQPGGHTMLNVSGGGRAKPSTVLYRRQ